MVVMPLMRRLLPMPLVLSSIGLRLRARALFSGSEPDESSSIGGGALFLRAAERVMGPKYPSFPLVSEGVGEGDMTRGVCGIAYCEEAMVECMQTGNEGSGEWRMSPDKDARGEVLKYAIAPNPKAVCFLLPRGRGTVGEAGGLRLFWCKASGSP